MLGSGDSKGYLELAGGMAVKSSMYNPSPVVRQRLENSSLVIYLGVDFLKSMAQISNLCKIQR